MNRCGTHLGYKDHVADRTPKCAPCKRAHADQRANARRRHYLTGAVLVDSTGSIRRLRALAAIGWTMHDVGGRLGITPQTLRKLTQQQQVTRTTRDKVAAVYDEMSMTPGPSLRARNQAARKGWLPPLAYDDDGSIDDPAYRPAGTSRAPASFDEIAVERACRGDRVHLRPVERKEAVARLTRLGLSAAEIALRLDVTDRAVTRHRSSAA